MKLFRHFTAGTALAIGLGGMAAAQPYTIGISNTVQGNGWREEMICAMKAQALVSGKVASLNVAHRNTDAAGQAEDIRNLIEAGVDAIDLAMDSLSGLTSQPNLGSVVSALRHGTRDSGLDPATIRAARHTFDATGHYSRPDIFSVTVDRRRQTAATFLDDPRR